MTIVDKIRKYLSRSGASKLSKISSALEINRGEVNHLLHENSALFFKNDENKWALVNNDYSVVQVQVDSKMSERADTVLVVENIDLVDRLKDDLNRKPYQKIKSLAKRLNVSRSLVTRSIHHYSEIFEKNEHSEWCLKTVPSESLTDDVAEIKKSPSDSDSDSDTELSDIRFIEKKKAPHLAVIKATVNKNFLVLAPPGTGKTYTLIERLVYLIESSGSDLNPTEILVLSFTRAAVGEIRKRIATAMADGAPRGLRYVRVMTFDAYSTWILNDGGYEFSSKNYDERIKLLTKELNTLKLKQMTDRISRTRFLLIDEIQDLVGVRANLVFELVKRVLTVHGAVMLLGDPHQSLNDYQLKDNKQTGSAKFLEKVQDLLRGDLEQIKLKESHRYETEMMKKLAIEAKNILDKNNLSAQEKFDVLKSLIPVSSKAKMVKKLYETEICALLCRSNAEVFQWVNWCKKQRIPFSVNEGAINRPWPPWIGESFMNYQQEKISHDHLHKRISAITEADFSINSKQLDIFLANEKLLRSSMIELNELAFRIKYLSPVLDKENIENGVIISTIHKAKGLEYKNVMVVEPYNKNITDEEVRILYVAITRAKCSIHLIPQKQLPFSGTMRKLKKGGHLRYVEDGVKYVQIIGMEDFNLDSLFIDKNGSVDINNIENYLLSYRECRNYLIQPESCNKENDHNYALYLKSDLGLIRMCTIASNLKNSLDAMSFGNKYGTNGAELDMGSKTNYQTIVHPLESPILSRLIGPSGIMVFPDIRGFYPIKQATGD